MNIFLTGSTGYIGSAVMAALVDVGHTVTALVRSDEAARKIESAGAVPIVGDMRDARLVTDNARASDAVIATASPGDETSQAADEDFVSAVLTGLGDSGKAFIRTGGIWVHGSGSDITEDTPRDAPSIVAWRERLDDLVLEQSGIRAVLIEPGIVYGHGGGIPNVVVGSEQSGGSQPALTLIGDGTQHWGTVHVDDLAALYVAALDKAEHGSIVLGVNGNNPTTRELGVAASRALGLEGRVIAETPEATVDRLGAFGEALLLDQQATGERARRVLGWAPTRPTLAATIEAGAYPLA